MRGAETEGKIKGLARRCLPSQSARGLDAAQSLWLPVPRIAPMPHPYRADGVPPINHCARLRLSLRHGLA